MTWSFLRNLMQFQFLLKVSFMCEADAETALNTNQHILEGRPVRVKPALESATDNHYTYE